MAEPPKSIDEVMQRMPQQFNSAAAQGMTAVYQFCITGTGGKNFYCAIKDGQLDVSEGKHDKPSVTITVAHDDYLKMLSDPAAGQALFMQGKITAQPMDMNLLMKMGQIFPAQ